jgi:hypothetical protein
VFLTCAGSCGIVALAFLATLTKPEPSAPVAPDAFRQTLARVHAQVPESPPSADAVCPDDVLRRTASAHITQDANGASRLWIPRVSYESLAEFVEKGPTTLDRPGPSLVPTREELGLDPAPPTGPDDWLWLEDAGLRVVFHPNLTLDSDPEESRQHTMQDTLGRRYLAVLRASSRSMPRIVDGGTQKELLDRRRELRSGENFTPGVFSGLIVVMDVAAASVVCQAPLDVHSSASVVYRHRTRFPLIRQQPTQVLADDFQERFRVEVRAAMERISKLAETSW